MARIAKLSAYVPSQVEGAKSQGADCHDVAGGHWIDGGMGPISNPMSHWPEYSASRKSWGINALGSVVVVAESDTGEKGVGITIGGPPAAYMIEKHLSRFVEGQRVEDIERMWDLMFRGSVNYGRKGLPVQALSAVDLALWDLLGHVNRTPVYNLLGGKARDRLPVYCTGPSAASAKALGFCGAKVPNRYGPSAGEKGFLENVKFLEEEREAVGSAFPLALDCYMSLTVPYATRLAKTLAEKVQLKWFEEPLVPDNVDGMASIRKAVGGATYITCGEHEYTRWGFRQLLEKECVDILQPDVTWCGGLTESRRAVALASAYDVPVVPHGSSVYSYHLQYAFPSTPLAEFINLHPNGSAIAPYFGNLFLDEPLPVNGFIDLDPSKPGFGVTLNPDVKLERPCARSDEDSKVQYERNATRQLPSETFMPL